MHKEFFEERRKEIEELILLAKRERDKLHIITVFDDPYHTEAPSGMIFPVEIEDIEAGFSFAATYYNGYDSYTAFKTAIKENTFTNPKIKYLVYSTSQIGKDVNRRSYVPFLCKQNNLKLLTCDAYRLCLLMDKSHYFALLKDLSHIPQTLTYYGQDNFRNTIQSPFVILKPALECAATGVTKLENDSSKIIKKLSAMQKQYGQKILVQEYIDGYEVGIPVLEKKGQYISSPPIWVKFNGDILNYEKVDNFKYSFTTLPDKTFPCNDIIPEMCMHAEQVMQFVGAQGLTRVDYRISPDKKFYIIDIAALPVLADTGTCLQSYKSLFEKKEAMFEAIVGSCLF